MSQNCSSTASPNPRPLCPRWVCSMQLTQPSNNSLRIVKSGALSALYLNEGENPVKFVLTILWPMHTELCGKKELFC